MLISGIMHTTGCAYSGGILVQYLVYTCTQNVWRVASGVWIGEQNITLEGFYSRPVIYDVNTAVFR